MAGRRNPEFEGMRSDHPHDLDREEGIMPPEGPSLPPPPLHVDPRSHIFLLETNKHLIAGRAKHYDNVSLQEIMLDGKLIDWLGISKREPRLTPLEAAFLREQKKNVLYDGASCKTFQTYTI